MVNGLSWPDAEQRRLIYGGLPVYDRAVAVADGSHFHITRPNSKNNHRSYYTSVKHKYSLNYIFVVDCYGFVIGLYGPYRGRHNDRYCWNNCPLGMNPALYLSEGEVILVDGGFIGSGPLMFQYTAWELAQATKAGVLLQAEIFNEEFKLDRTLVEHVIGSVKLSFPFLAHRFQGALYNHPQFTFAAVRVFNRIRKDRFLRAVQHISL